jgi:hypothetical protein
MSPPSDHAARSRACQEPENAGRTPAARGVGRWGGVASSTTLDRRASTRSIVFYPFAVLLDGINHVAVLTGDTDRLSRFYTEVFDTPPARTIEHQPGFKLSLIDIGDGRELNVFEIDGNSEANRQTPMFGRALQLTRRNADITLAARACPNRIHVPPSPAPRSQTARTKSPQTARTETPESTLRRIGATQIGRATMRRNE